MQALLQRGKVPTVVTRTAVECLRLTRSAFQGQASLPGGSGYQQTIGRPSCPSPRFEWVGQEHQADCGLAALAMIARYHGLSLTVDQLRQRFQPKGQGATLIQLVQLSQAIGLPCTAVRIDPLQWGQLRVPAIIHLKEGHFVVLFQLDVGGVRIGDPATGLLTQTLASFRERCSGQALVFTEPR